MKVRGVRGATTVENNSAEEILAATRELVQALIKENDLQAEDICSVLFTATKDLDTVYPAKAVREMGWHMVPLQCVQELNVAGSLPLCIRVLLHINTSKNQKDIKHVYLRDRKSVV